ncbi:glycosyltransferase family 2 protein [Botrimarina mediterranea]|uniref:Hyaluronan synthase n=1 Tax=Botrimarina mediterranea TaxID=2528022 RepID=A0A518K2U5_9BACT|nr:glycosyltransferase [Botrimarina mediterranea]QDV72121.1 Hyaluronan synthase [Botrimarina mediterranea]
MRLSCLINNYNYGRFVAEAVDSALSQSAPFDEIIVVDDGSNDQSLAVLSALEQRCPRLKVVRKPNGGQLSAFSAGLAASTGDVLYFLDADDLFEPNYVERTAGVFQTRPDVGYVFSGRRLFGRIERVERPFSDEIDLGYSVAVLATGGVWCGASTSCVSMRRSTLERLLPAPDMDPLWRINADLCLAYGASLAGVRKYCVPEPLVAYRVHDHNAHYGKPEDAAGKYQRRLQAQTLIEHYSRRLGLDRAQLAELLHLEFMTVPKPTHAMLKRYLRTTLASRSRLTRRIGLAWTIWRHYYRSRHAPAPIAARYEQRRDLNLYTPAKAS